MSAVRVPESVPVIEEKKEAARKIPKKPTTTVIVKKTTAPASATAATAASASLPKPATPIHVTATTAAPAANNATPITSTTITTAASNTSSVPALASSGPRPMSDDDDDDDDHLPLHQRVKKEEAKSQPSPPAAKPAARPAPAPSLDSDDEEEEWTGAAASSTGANGAAAGTRANAGAVAELESKSEPRRTVAAKHPSLQRIVESDADEDDDENENDAENEEDEQADEEEEEADVSEASEEEEEVRPKSKKRARAPAKPRKSRAATKPKKRRKRGSDSEFSDDENEEEDSDERASDEEADDSATKSEVHSDTHYEQRTTVTELKELHGANKWWNRQEHRGKKKWETLEHNGVLFPPEYLPHGLPVVYAGQEIALEPEAEEVASMYAAMLDTAPQFTANPTFNKNFFHDWRALLGTASPIKSLAKCDFTRIREHLASERETKKAKKKTHPELAKAEKMERERIQSVYGFALVDGFKEKVGNFRVEPPNLFRGRGAHPKTGRLKTRVSPEDITINIGLGVPIPPCPPGHHWKGICHNNTVTWLAFWHDNVNEGFKYVWLAPSSKFKGQSDIAKFSKAQLLKTKIADIRANYTKEMKSSKLVERQRATAIYLIDFLALRVGNEKDTNEVADTVGCCSLRVEHVKFEANCTVTFDFLGKDSMQYLNTVQLTPEAYRNLQEFCKRKKPAEDIFDTLDTASLNEHLKSLMPGLTAKVFRTYNASYTLQKELRETPAHDVPIEAPVSKKVLEYTKCNRIVAVLCNHQRSVPRGHDAQIQKLKDRLEELKDEREEIVDWQQQIEEEEKPKAKKKSSSDAAQQRALRREARKERAVARRERRRVELEELAAKGGEKAKKDLEKLNEDDEKEERSLPPEAKKLATKLTAVAARIETVANNIAEKDESKQVALGTSKINYMDPRITVAWCKEKEVPIEKIFNKSLLAKFPWALEVCSTWRF